MNETTDTRPQITHEQISRRAQELWEKYGRPSGRDEEIWLEAERSLQGPAAPTAAPEVSSSTGGPSSESSTAPSARGARKAGGASATAKMPSPRTGDRSGSR